VPKADYVDRIKYGIEDVVIMVTFIYSTAVSYRFTGKLTICFGNLSMRS